jgi:hypothetical protein
VNSKKAAETSPIDIGLDGDFETPVRRRVDVDAARAVAEEKGYGRSLDAASVSKKVPPATASSFPTAAAPREAVPGRIDGRSLRRTGRNEQLNAKVTEQVRNGFLRLQQERGVTLGELLEEGLELLQAKYRN